MSAGRFHTFAVAALGVAGWGGCQGGASAPAGARQDVVTARDGDGALRLEARVGGGRCALTGETALAVSRDPGGAVARTPATGDVEALRLGPSRTPGDQQVAGPDGAPRVRIHRGAGRVDLLGPDDVPLARVQVDGAAGKIVDAARAPIAVLARDAAAITVTDASGAVVATVTGTSDLEVAALLVAPGVPADVRGLLACERLLDGAPAAGSP